VWQHVWFQHLHIQDTQHMRGARMTLSHVRAGVGGP
jgi:hypothetical protein